MPISPRCCCSCCFFSSALPCLHLFRAAARRLFQVVVVPRRELPSLFWAAVSEESAALPGASVVLEPLRRFSGTLHAFPRGGLVVLCGSAFVSWAHCVCAALCYFELPFP